MAKPLPKCRFCGAAPKVERLGPLYQVQCNCGAHSWPRETVEAAVRIWGGDKNGDGYQQLKMD